MRDSAYRLQPGLCIGNGIKKLDAALAGLAKKKVPKISIELDDGDPNVDNHTSARGRPLSPTHRHEQKRAYSTK
jgi:hypothetical protein